MYLNARQLLFFFFFTRNVPVQFFVHFSEVMFVNYNSWKSFYFFFFFIRSRCLHIFRLIARAAWLASPGYTACTNRSARCVELSNKANRTLTNTHNNIKLWVTIRRRLLAARTESNSLSGSRVLQILGKPLQNRNETRNRVKCTRFDVVFYRRRTWNIIIPGESTPWTVRSTCTDD